MKDWRSSWNVIFNNDVLKFMWTLLWRFWPRSSEGTQLPLVVWNHFQCFHVFRTEQKKQLVRTTFQLKEPRQWTLLKCWKDPGGNYKLNVWLGSMEQLEFGGPVVVSAGSLSHCHDFLTDTAIMNVTGYTPFPLWLVNCLYLDYLKVSGSLFYIHFFCANPFENQDISIYVCTVGAIVNRGHC